MSKTCTFPTAPRYTNDRVSLYQGDSLKLLQQFPDESVDAVVTDPPYSSGGTYSRNRARTASQKYVNSDAKKQHPDFFGEHRDQRAYTKWCALWMAECYRIARPGAHMISFIDWRQLPCLTDAIQIGGWLWRGIVVWDKTLGSRPIKGWYRLQCEYVLVATKGTPDPSLNTGVTAPGCFRYMSSHAKKQHIAGKPLELMKDLLQVVPSKATVLDPFAGSGTTLLAATELDMKGIGIEQSDVYCERIQERLNLSASKAHLN